MTTAGAISVDAATRRPSKIAQREEREEDSEGSHGAALQPRGGGGTTWGPPLPDAVRVRRFESRTPEPPPPAAVIDGLDCCDWALVGGDPTLNTAIKSAQKVKLFRMLP